MGVGVAEGVGPPCGVVVTASVGEAEPVGDAVALCGPSFPAPQAMSRDAASSTAKARKSRAGLLSRGKGIDTAPKFSH